MSEQIKYILGGDSLTVYLDKKPYTVNRTAPTFGIVLKAVKDNDLSALRDALDVRTHIAKSLNVKGNGKVKIVGSQILYGDREVTGLIASRIFEVLRVGLDVQPMVNFLENLMSNPSKRAVDELFGFLEKCKLPITGDGHFLAYKRVRADYKDVHSSTMDNSVGQKLTMPRNMVDEDKNQTCSNGLHFCSYDYLSSFSGERIMVLKINPADVVAIPADYNDTKGRTCAYEVVDELSVNDYDSLPSRPITEDFTSEYGATSVEDAEWEESEEEWEESEAPTPVSPVKSTDVAALTASDVRQIQKLLRNNTSLAAVGRMFKRHPRTIARIRDGEAYGNV